MQSNLLAKLFPRNFPLSHMASLFILCNYWFDKMMLCSLLQTCIPSTQTAPLRLGRTMRDFFTRTDVTRSGPKDIAKDGESSLEFR